MLAIGGCLGSLLVVLRLRVRLFLGLMLHCRCDILWRSIIISPSRLDLVNVDDEVVLEGHLKLHRAGRFLTLTPARLLAIAVVLHTHHDDPLHHRQILLLFLAQSSAARLADVVVVVSILLFSATAGFTTDELLCTSFALSEASPDVVVTLLQGCHAVGMVLLLASGSPSMVRLNCRRFGSHHLTRLGGLLLLLLLFLRLDE